MLTCAKIFIGYVGTVALIQKDLIAIRNELKQDGKNLKSHVDTFGYLICGMVVLGFSILGFLITFHK